VIPLDLESFPGLSHGRYADHNTKKLIRTAPARDLRSACADDEPATPEFRQPLVRAMTGSTPQCIEKRTPGLLSTTYESNAHGQGIELCCSRITKRSGS